MSEILLQIDGKEVAATEGMTLLEVAQKAGIFIPTLCHDERLEGYGACRICTVEIEKRGWTQYVAACLYPVEKNLVVRTRSERIDQIRKMLLDLMLAHAPESLALQDLAKQYGANQERFEKEPDFCILCGLCVRYCAEVKKKHAVSFADRGVRREIQFIPEIASKECWNCKECFPLCPTSYLQAAYFLAEGLAFPPIFTSEE
ncbi:MAG: 2Fe-2S iron-sulfur cluster binding domain-containing protein [Deltaproteobacteria bacterium]|nr:2Fe-2S iron-sulfur cluster binding domain-containing protein [Deltaproteobacteria bacterium]